MMTLAQYLELGTDPTSIGAAALVADQSDHALTATVVTLTDIAAQQEANGHTLEAHVMRRAARWLQAETEAHRQVRDELVQRSGYGDALAGLLRERRAAAVATRAASGPLFRLCGQYMSLALRHAALDESEALLATGEPLGEQVAAAVLDFAAAIKGAAP